MLLLPTIQWLFFRPTNTNRRMMKMEACTPLLEHFWNKTRINSTNHIVKRFSAVGPTSTRIKRMAFEQVVLYLREQKVIAVSKAHYLSPWLAFNGPCTWKRQCLRIPCGLHDCLLPWQGLWDDGCARTVARWLDCRIDRGLWTHLPTNPLLICLMNLPRTFRRCSSTSSRPSRPGRCLTRLSSQSVSSTLSSPCTKRSSIFHRMSPRIPRWRRKLKWQAQQIGAHV